jgi:hypothetical protein
MHQRIRLYQGGRQAVQDQKKHTNRFFSLSQRVVVSHHSFGCQCGLLITPSQRTAAPPGMFPAAPAESISSLVPRTSEIYFPPGPPSLTVAAAYGCMHLAPSTGKYDSAIIDIKLSLAGP